MTGALAFEDPRWIPCSPVAGKHAVSLDGDPEVGPELAALFDHYHDESPARHRLQELLIASQSILGGLDLSVVLRRIVESACRLTGARYGALGVLAPGGRSLDQFLTVGIDERTAARIGDLPTGKGLLGALIDDPRPIRLESMADDPRSAGFPAHHPPMSSFLGVPVRVDAQVFGNLYLADSSVGRFSADDEQLVTALAATAGVAIANARLFERAQQRQQWLEASAVITRQLLAVEGEDPLALIARKALEIAVADLVTVVIPTADGRSLLVEVAAGHETDHLAGYVYPRENSLVGVALDTEQAVSVRDASHGTVPWHQTSALQVGPAMVIPLAGAGGPRGALAIGRALDGHPFDEADLEMASAFANQAALALELADARAYQQKLDVLEDRDRIARDLHDHVIQRLFAAGLTVEGVLPRVVDPQAHERLSRLVGDLDTTIVQIRTSVFDLRGPLLAAGQSARRRVLDLVDEVTPLLPARPDVRFAGLVDTVIDDGALTDLLATLREALTNVARHADARKVAVELTAEQRRAVLVLEDDGVGMGTTTRRSGLANLRARAERHGGTLDVGAAGGPPDRRGTRLTWSIQLG